MSSVIENPALLKADIEVNKAKKNLELLKTYCGTSCAEYKDLDKAIKSYKK